MYPSLPIVGVGAVVLEGDRILLIKRSRPPGAGKYSVPGGIQKLKESIYEAAVRELKEETGIEGRPIGVINVDEYLEYENGVVKFHYVLIDILIEPRNRLCEARPMNDAAEVLIVKLSDATKYELTESTKSLIEKLLKGALNVIESRIIVHKAG